MTWDEKQAMSPDVEDLRDTTSLAGKWRNLKHNVSAKTTQTVNELKNEYNGTTSSGQISFAANNAPVTLDFSKAQPIHPVTLDFSKAQPIGSHTEPGMLEPHHDWTDPIRGAAAGVKQLVMHPIDSLTQVPSIAATPTPTIYGAPQAQQQAVDAQNKVVNENAANIRSQVQAAKDAPAFTVGAIAGPLLLTHGVTKLAPKIPGMVGAVPDAVSSAKTKLYPQSQSLTADVSAARNLSKALIIDPAGVSNFVKAATDEAGTVVGYAKDKGLPINSKADFANAAKQAADAVQTHFDDAILKPNAKTVVSVPDSYQGPRVGEGNNATLESINSRIDAISSELKSNYRKPLQAQTSAANTSDADLIGEKRALVNILHKQLSAATGISPEAIGDLRVQAGKLRTIADEANASANRDLTASGKQAMGTTTSAVGTKAGLLDRGLQMVQGGPEVIGNRQINSALPKIQPKPLNLPQPTPVVATPAVRTPIAGPSTTISGPDYTPDPNAGAILKAKIQARQTALPRWAEQGAANMAAEGLSAEDVKALSSTPRGQQLLQRASGTKPGSALSNSLVYQAQRMLGR